MKQRRENVPRLREIITIIIENRGLSISAIHRKSTVSYPYLLQLLSRLYLKGHIYYEKGKRDEKKVYPTSKVINAAMCAKWITGDTCAQ